MARRRSGSTVESDEPRGWRGLAALRGSTTAATCDYARRTWGNGLGQALRAGKRASGTGHAVHAGALGITRALGSESGSRGAQSRPLDTDRTNGWHEDRRCTPRRTARQCQRHANFRHNVGRDGGEQWCHRGHYPWATGCGVRAGGAALAKRQQRRARVAGSRHGQRAPSAGHFHHANAAGTSQQRRGQTRLEAASEGDPRTTAGNRLAAMAAGR